MSNFCNRNKEVDIVIDILTRFAENKDEMENKVWFLDKTTSQSNL